MENYVGEKLGNYRLTRLLGVGGFAKVYLGEHIYLKTQAAIKVLHASLDADALAQFLIEARTIAHFGHPNIIRTLEFGVQGSTAYLVMSYAPNGTVLRRYPRGSIVPLHIVLQYVRQIADALQYAHAHELIHRDVKPENILLGRDGEILLSDFGLAVLSSSLQSGRLTDEAGTVSYMAPEQIEGKPNSASDQYALGVVVYEWLCGKLPFTGLDDEIAIQHLQVPPPSLSKLAPSVPSTIEQVVMKALAKDPSERFLSVLHFAQTLEEAYQPHKLVQLLRLDSNGQSVDAGDTSLKHDTPNIAETQPLAGFQSSSVHDSNVDDKITSSLQKALARLSALVPSVHIPQSISQRIILAGLAALIVVSVGAFWSFHNLRSSASSPRSSSRIVQASRTSEATPGITNTRVSGSSTSPATSGLPHPTSTQNGGSTTGTTSASAAMSTPQVTPTANTTTTSTSAYTVSVNTASTSTPQVTPTANTTTTTSTSAYTVSVNTAPTPTPTVKPTPTPLPIPTALSIPTPLPIPTISIPKSGSSQQGDQEQHDGQEKNDQ